MQLFNSLHYANPMQTYAGGITDEIKALGKDLQERYDTNVAMSDKLLSKLDGLQVEDRNAPILQNAKQKLRDEIDKVAKSGDFENAGTKMRILGNEIANDPLLRGAVQSKAKYDAYKKDLEERYSKGEISREAYEGGLTVSKQNNTAMGEVDPTTGVYKNDFSGYTPMKKVELDKKAIEFADKIKASKTPIVIGKNAKGEDIMMWNDNTTGQFMVSGSKEGIGEAEALDLISNYLSNDETVSSYLAEQLRFDKAKRQVEQRGNIPYTLQDITNLTGQTEEQIKEKLKAEGLDPETVIGNPKLMENLYDNLYKTSKVTKVAAPIAGAISYTKTDLDYKEDKDRSRNLDFSLAMRKMMKEKELDLEAYKAKKQIDAEAAAKAASAYTVSNASPIDLRYEPAKNEMNLKDLTSQIEAVEARIKFAESRGNAVLNEDVVTLAELKNKRAVAERANQSYRVTAADTPEGERRLNEFYELYKKRGGTEYSDFTAFKDAFVKQSYRLPYKATVSGMGTETTDNIANASTQDANSVFLTAEMAFKNNDKIIEAANGSMKRPRGNVLSGAYKGSADTHDYIKDEKASPLDKFNQLYTTAVLSTPGEFMLADGTPLDKVIEGAGYYEIEGSDDKMSKKRNVMVQAFDRDVNGEQTLQLTVFDDKQGKDVTYNIRPKNQASLKDNYKRLNQDLVKMHGRDSEVGRNAQLHLNDIELPEFNVQDADKQTRFVTPRTPEGVGAFTQPVILNVQNTPMKVAVVARNVQVPIIEDGKVVRTQLQKRYQIVRVANNTPTDKVLTDKNIGDYVDGTQVDAMFTNPNLVQDPIYSGAVTEKGKLTYFNSLTEAKSFMAALQHIK